MWKKIYHPYHQKRAAVATLISNSTDLTIKIDTGVKKGHFIMKKGPIHQEDVTIMKIRFPNCPKIHEVKADGTEGRNSSTVIAGDFSAFSNGRNDWTEAQRRADPDDAVSQRDFTDTRHKSTSSQEHVERSSGHTIMLENKTSLSTFKSSNSTQSTFF